MWDTLVNIFGLNIKVLFSLNRNRRKKETEFMRTTRKLAAVRDGLIRDSFAM